jgi:hypothetical protein
MDRIAVDISVPSDRTSHVASLMVSGQPDREQLAGVNEEGAARAVEIYPRRDGESWRIG